MVPLTVTVRWLLDGRDVTQEAVAAHRCGTCGAWVPDQQSTVQRR